MNNEPVAWMLVDKNWNDFCRYSSYPSEGAIPLYIHPAEHDLGIAEAIGFEKGHEDGRKLAVVNTLTEARILKVIEKTHFADGYLNANLIKFAEAILKKASEK
jgi:hypothetical protein